MDSLPATAIKKSGIPILKDLIGLFMRDPTAALSLAEDLKNVYSTIRDGIFWDSLETYLLCSYSFDAKTNQFKTENLQALAVALADASPNAEANYEGHPEKLIEYAKRLIKMIDDCGTKQKAYYLGCITRALLSKQIDTQKFFQLSRCIRNLTEEDLLFLSENIDTGNVSRNEDYIEDYRALGLLYETDEGFSYSKRAFELKKYALCYETHTEIPDRFPQKYVPLIAKPISDDKIRSLTDEVGEIKESLQLGDF